MQTVTAVGVPESIALGNTGNGYNVGDRLEPTFSIDTTVPIQGTPWIGTVEGFSIMLHIMYKLIQHKIQT